MKFKWKALIAAGVMACSVAAFAGCASNDAGGTGDGGKEEDYGTLTIADSKVYITEGRDYTFAEIQPVFSKPDKAETLSYTYDDTDIKIENGIVTPLKRADKEVNVRAKSEHFNVVFKVEVEYLHFTGSLYDLSGFPVAQRTETCKAVTADTTLFLGDSFTDDYFIGNYMTAYSADKKVMNAGMSSTTSYHWEAAYKTVIGETAPKNIVLHVGTNNFYDAHDMVDTTEESLTRLMMFIHSSYPESKIYWFNITQRVNTAHASKVTETNAYMAEWCAKYDWVTCVDTCSKISPSHLRDDGTHPTDEGYKIFTDELAKAGCEIINK